MSKRIKKDIVRIIIGTAVLIAAVLISKLLNIWAGLAVYIISYLVLGFDVLKSAGKNIIRGNIFDENFLMLIATIGAFACGEYSEAVFVMLFFQVGEVFQNYAVEKSRKSIKALMSIRPEFARVVRDGEELQVKPNKVKQTEQIVVYPGERIPLDGVVTEGASTIDTAAITGESIPRKAEVGTPVVSGCINLSGVLKIEVTATASQSTVSRILQLVEDAQAKKARAEKFITVFARYYTPIVTIAAAVLAIGGTIITGDVKTWIYRAMTFLLISCPCALVISIPLSFFGGIGGAGRKGVLIKGGNYMDTLSKTETLVLDKTGTITKGNFKVIEFVKSDDFEGSREELHRIIASIESKSSHPIARSIVESYEGDDLLLPENLEEIAGKGIKAEIDGVDYYVGNQSLLQDILAKEEFSKAMDEYAVVDMKATTVYVAAKGVLAGRIQIADEIKEGVKDALNLCREVGIKRFVMLSGDNESTAKAVAKEVGIDEVFAGLSPIDKVNKLEELLKEAGSGKVAFAGDGINDAPVLSRADLGIAMGAMGSDAAIEAADVVIMTDDIEKISFGKRIASKTLRIVKENIIFALGVKGLVLVLAALGLTSMWMAIFADVGVAFIAIMNAMRPLRD